MQSYSFLQDNGDGGISDDGDQPMVNTDKAAKKGQNSHHSIGYPAHSHHDKIPPWWGNVSNDKGGIMSVTKSYHT